MAWKEVSKMESRREFVSLARQPGANIRELCRRFGISPTTGYKWIGRARLGEETFIDRSRRPHRTPGKTAEEMEQRLLEIRDAHPVWNARKVRRVVQREGSGSAVPAASTVHAILKRNGRISEAASAAAHTWKRFEHEQPNDLSQIDFKGHFAIARGRCYPLTMLDDHSRYVQLLVACADERTETVRTHLISAFRRYGLPWAMNMDNGNPWGNPTGDPYTKLTVWLIRLGIRVSHSRPLHPQTNGKDERFHQTLGVELLARSSFTTLEEVQRSFDRWRPVYNHERPHESLNLDVPAQHYRPSPRSYPEQLPPLEYSMTDWVVKVRGNGMILVGRRKYVHLSQAFANEHVALRRTNLDGQLDVYYAHQRIARFDESTGLLSRIRRQQD